MPSLLDLKPTRTVTFRSLKETSLSVAMASFRRGREVLYFHQDTVRNTHPGVDIQQHKNDRLVHFQYCTEVNRPSEQLLYHKDTYWFRHYWEL